MAKKIRPAKTAKRPAKRQSSASATRRKDDTSDSLPSGYIRDFISGQQIRATPEETQAVQVFARRLVDDFG